MMPQMMGGRPPYPYDVYGGLVADAGPPRYPYAMYPPPPYANYDFAVQSAGPQFAPYYNPTAPQSHPPTNQVPAPEATDLELIIRQQPMQARMDLSMKAFVVHASLRSADGLEEVITTPRVPGNMSILVGGLVSAAVMMPKTDADDIDDDGQTTRQAPHEGSEPNKKGKSSSSATAAAAAAAESTFAGESSTSNVPMGCFFVFPELSVRLDGSYRLRFSLIELGDMNTPVAAKMVVTVDSDPFTVYNAKEFPGMQESSDLTKRLATQGFRVPIRKQHRSKVAAGSAKDQAGSSSGRSGSGPSRKEKASGDEEGGRRGAGGGRKRGRGVDEGFSAETEELGYDEEEEE
ncbi:hypothetical protein HK102_006144 [Quaeritorhiza haematococci]|nr:hypothetical protein HK102_006144 [Quaeritorhiza haematococci]